MTAAAPQLSRQSPSRQSLARAHETFSGTEGSSDGGGSDGTGRRSYKGIGSKGDDDDDDDDDGGVANASALQGILELLRSQRPLTPRAPAPSDAPSDHAATGADKGANAAAPDGVQLGGSPEHFPLEAKGVCSAPWVPPSRALGLLL